MNEETINVNNMEARLESSSQNSASVAQGGCQRVSPATMGSDAAPEKALAADLAGSGKTASSVAVIVGACLIALIVVVLGFGYAFGWFGGSDEATDDVAVTTVEKTVNDDDAPADDSAEAESADESESESADSSTGDSSPESSAAAGAAASSATAAGSSSGVSSGGSSSSSTGQNPAPAPDPAPSPSTITVYVTIDSSAASSYGVSGPSMGASVTLPQGSTVYDALCAMGVSVSGSSYYVTAIGGLAEKQCGSGSGWTYSVNGSFLGMACGRCVLNGGESVLWVYTTEKNPTI